jgi:hypothetical protein
MFPAAKFNALRQWWHYQSKVHAIAVRLADKYGPVEAQALARSAARRYSGQRGEIARSIAEAIENLNRLDIYYH